MQAYLETIFCKFGRDPAICLVKEAICAKCLQTDGETDIQTYGRTDGRRTPRYRISLWNQLKIKNDRSIRLSGTPGTLSLCTE